MSPAGRPHPTRVTAPDLQTAPERFSADWLAAHLAELIGPLRGRRLAVAFSGGLDSSTLLAALASLRRRQHLVLRALHVNHHLHGEAADWAEAARLQARRLRVPFVLIDAAVVRSAGESLESQARATRYQALSRHLQHDELLLTAHHQEDQLETVLLALLRGSGVRGLSAMSAITPWAGTQLLRPLLCVGRAQLERYAREQALKWSDDPSNLDERFDRNYLRLRVLPLIRQRWPAAAATIGRSAAHLAEARGLLEQQARATLLPARDGAALRVSVLSRLPLPQRRNALRQWIGERGLLAPDHRRLREIAGPMLRARADALPAVRWPGAELRRHGDRLFALSASAASLAARMSPEPWDWRQRAWLPLADGSALGLVREPHGDVRLAALPPRLQVSFRQGGERLHTSGGRVALKDLLQAQGLPPWQRTGVPLIGDRERIIAVADLWLDPAYRAAGRGGRGGRGRFRWRHSD